MYSVEILFHQPQSVDEEQYYLTRSVSIWNGILTAREVMRIGGVIDINKDFQKLVDDISQHTYWFAIMMDWDNDPHVMDDNETMRSKYSYPNGVMVCFENRDDALVFKLTHRPTHV